jgi:hypothetical protein
LGGSETHINFREQANDARLDGREKLMNIRHSRITSDEQRLLTTPVIGNNSELMALRAKVEALTTYVPLPVPAEREVSLILASCQSEAAAPIQFAMSGK